jgi:hypothetical protein
MSKPFLSRRELIQAAAALGLVPGMHQASHAQSEPIRFGFQNTSCPNTNPIRSLPQQQMASSQATLPSPQAALQNLL